MKCYMMLALASFCSLSFAQPIQNHGPSEVNNAVDIIEGKNNRLFLSTTGGIYFSDDIGEQWHRLEAQMNTIYMHPHFSINERNGDLYAWDLEDGVFSTPDNGVTWKQELLIMPSGDNLFKVVAIDGDTLFVGTDKGLKFFFGSENIRTANEVSDLVNKNITSLNVHGKTVIVGTESDGIFVSEDNGKTWQNRSTGLPSDFNVTGITVSLPVIFAYSNFKGVYYSTDGGMNWIAKNTGFSVNSVNKIFVDNDLLYAATNSYNNVYRSDLVTESWTLIDNGIADGDLPSSLWASGNNLIVGTWNNLYKSTDAGGLFESSHNGLTDAFQFRNMEVSTDGTIWAIGSHTGIYKMEPQENTFTTFLKLNGGNLGRASLRGNLLQVLEDYKVKFYDIVLKEWVDEMVYLNAPFASQLIEINDEFYLSTQLNGIFKYSGSPNWVAYNEGLESLSISDFIYSGDRFLAGTEAGLFSRKTGDLTWNKISFSSFDPGVRKLFVKENLMLISSSNYNTYLSVDDGENWRLIEKFTNQDITAYTSSGDLLFATSYGHLYVSADNGMTWFDRELPDVFINSMVVANGKLYLGTLERGVWSTSLKIDQRLIYSSIPETLNVEEPYLLRANATSGLPITYELVSGPAMLNNYELTFNGVGLVVVRARQGGDEIYNAVTEDYSFNVNVITSIEGESISNFSVFPNPASTTINVSQVDDRMYGIVELMDMAGKTITGKIKVEGKVEIPVSNLPVGMYFIRYTDNNKIETKKLIIKKK